MLVIAERPASELVEALGDAGAFPVIEATWADAPTAFVTVKPAAIVIAEAGPAKSEAAARMLCLQIATARGPVVPVIARTGRNEDVALPIALPANLELPIEGLVTRLRSALRVQTLHAAVLRRIETFATQVGKVPDLPVGDALEDATVMIVGRGPLYPKLSVAIGERVRVVGALSVETATRYLNSRDIDGIVLGDGFNERTIEAFLMVLTQDNRYRDIPIVAIGDVAQDLAERLTNIEQVEHDPARAVTRIVPMARQHAFECRLKRILKTLETEGMFDPKTGLHSRDHFFHDLGRSVADAENRGHPLSIARISFTGAPDHHTHRDNARLITRLTRNVDFAYQNEDGSLLVVFNQTDLRSAHVVARRMAATLRSKMLDTDRGQVHAKVTLATLKANDNVDSLLRRVMDSEVVAAE